jgi:1-acyl-sn-glycerol-3-phosphate acyltransferase
MIQTGARAEDFGIEERSARLVRTIDRTARFLGVELEGIERLPATGPALLVTNHAFGFDAALLMARIEAVTGRRVWALGEHAWWKVPIVRRLAAAAGTVDGTHERADQLLSANELVLVLPGGLREAMKPHELRYRLLWGGRYGFIHAAMRNNAPIVPIASLGAEDVFDLAGNAFARARSLHLPFPLPRPLHLLHFAHRSSLRYVISDPIPMPPSPPHPDEHSSASDTAAAAAAARRIRREVEGAIHEVFEDRLMHKVGFDAPRSRVGSCGS